MEAVVWMDADKVLPDDGIEVLLGWAGDENKSLAIGFLDGDVWRTNYDEVILDPPTHWMLPEPPK